MRAGQRTPAPERDRARSRPGRRAGGRHSRLLGRPGWTSPLAWAAALVGTGVVLAAPVWASSYTLFLLGQILVFGLFATALNIVFGYGGMPSLGHAAFLGLGAYITALGMTRFDLSLGVILLLTLLGGAALGLAFGLLTARSSGAYLLILTLAASQALWALAYRWVSLTRGEVGITGLGRIDNWLTRLSDGEFHAVLVVAFVVCGFLMYRFKESVTGHALVASGDNPSRLLALGYHVNGVKLLTFAISGLFAAVAGLLLAFLQGFVGPQVAFWVTGAQGLVYAIVGGASAFLGPLLGAAALISLENWVSIHTSRWPTVLGVIMVLTMYVMPQGVLGRVQEVTDRLQPARRPTGPAPRGTLDGQPAGAPADVLGRAPQPATPRSGRGERGEQPAACEEPDGAGEFAIRVEGVTVTFGGVRALDDLTIEVPRGQRACIIGPNGAGKSTLFNVISGLQPADRGRVALLDRDVTGVDAMGRSRLGLGRTFQITSLFGRLSVADNVRLAVAASRASGRWNAWSPPSRIDWIDARARELLTDWNLDDLTRRKPAELAYGQQRLLEIVLALAQQPRVLLMDEPAAGLPKADAVIIHDALQQLPESLTVVLIEHNMDLAFAVADHITVLDKGRIIGRGSPAEVAENALVISIYLGRSHDVA